MVVILSSAGAVSHHDLTSLQDSSYRRRTNPQFDIDSKKSHAEQYTSKKDRTQSPLHCEHCPYRYDPSLTRLQHLLLDIHLTLEDPNFSFLAKALGTFIMVLILLSTLVFCIETLPELQEYTTVRKKRWWWCMVECAWEFVHGCVFTPLTLHRRGFCCDRSVSADFCPKWDRNSQMHAVFLSRIDIETKTLARIDPLRRPFIDKGEWSREWMHNDLLTVLARVSSFSCAHKHSLI